MKFSVITPSFQQGRFIERTIQSVLAQSAPDLAIDYIVCDGGSQDETVEVLHRYGDRLRWISAPDGGQAEAVNRGIALTQGEIIAWINSDDVYYLGALAAVQAVFAAQPQVQVMYGDADQIDAADRLLAPYPTEPWHYQRLPDICFLCQPAVFFRRSAIAQWGHLDASLKYCMDYELWLRYGRHTDFFYLPQKLAASRLHPATKTLGQRLAVHTEMNDMLKRQLGRVPDKWIFAHSQIKLEETLGLDRSQPDQNRQFIAALIPASRWAFGYWNGAVSATGWIQLWRWRVKVWWLRWGLGTVEPPR
jgi:glycosyltransferase involved in cell wall biosynthesis